MVAIQNSCQQLKLSIKNNKMNEDEHKHCPQQTNGKLTLNSCTSTNYNYQFQFPAQNIPVFSSDSLIPASTSLV